MRADNFVNMPCHNVKKVKETVDDFAANHFKILTVKIKYYLKN